MKKPLYSLFIFCLLAGTMHAQFPQAQPSGDPKPQPSINNVKVPVKTIAFKTNPSMRGFADLHCHQMANLAFGGQAFFGAAWGPVNQVLPWCTSVHGPGGAGDIMSNFLRGISYCTSILGHHVGGYPEFDGWPRWDNISHQAVYEDWLYRAFYGGLRLMVMLAVNNEFMCGGANKAPGRNCADDEAVRLQINAARQMETYIDNKYGGPGKGWYRIAYSSRQAREIIQSGKLAVILGVEVDYPMHSYQGNNLTEAAIENELNLYYSMGIRHVYPIHFDNNAFGGTAYDKILVQQAQDKIQNPIRPYKITTRQESIYKRDDGRCNVLGLTPAGKILVKKMMAKGMIIDVDHTSAIAKNDILTIAELYQYPAIVSGHTGFVELAKDPEKSHEGNLLPLEINRIRNLGGIIAPILNQGHDINEWKSGNTLIRQNCRGTAETFAQAYLYLKDHMYGRPIAIGSDFNGMINAFGPRFGSDACPCGKSSNSIYPRTQYPFTSLASYEIMNKSQAGNKIFDISDDGLAHAGMLPDMIAELQTLGISNVDLEPLMNGAKGYMEMWELAERRATGINNSLTNAPPPRTTVSQIIGRWVGTSGAGNSAEPNYFSFQLNSNMTIQVLDQSGNVVANGTFTFINNGLNATYTILKRTYSIFGSFIPESNILVGRWGTDPDATNGGRWVTKKQ